MTAPGSASAPDPDTPPLISVRKLTVEGSFLGVITKHVTLIRADRKVEHGRVIHVLDLLKRAGVAKIAFAVTPADAAPVPVEAAPAPGK